MFLRFSPFRRFLTIHPASSQSRRFRRLET